MSPVNVPLNLQSDLFYGFMASATSGSTFDEPAGQMGSRSSVCVERERCFFFFWGRTAASFLQLQPRCPGPSRAEPPANNQTESFQDLIRFPSGFECSKTYVESQTPLLKFGFGFMASPLSLSVCGAEKSIQGFSGWTYFSLSFNIFSMEQKDKEENRNLRPCSDLSCILLPFSVQDGFKIQK